MTNLKTTKRALLSSVVALLVCFTMLLGTTFAWFTDSVTSANNIIQTGTLDVEMYWAKGTEDPSSADWKDASQGAIFNSELWEPGYVEARHIKIANVGTLALKYKLAIAPNGEVSELADVIDVYFVDPAQIATRDSLAALTPVGTLRQMIDDPDGAAYGSLLAEDESTEEIESVKTVTIALKMRENAGNEYQNLSIGTNFSIVLMATQDNVEKDALDENYDNIEIPDKDVQVIEGNTYHYTIDGNVVLASVPYGNVDASFTVPDDVTILGQGDVYDGAVPVFSKSSPIESITLPEGLVEIKARAITGVKTLTSINFPSTLKAIRAQALRQTGMDELTVPANVEVIGEGAFRDMANLTTVTVDGNVAFDNNAFRSCPNLTSIYLLGDDVTFTSSQFATHSDNGDATGITIYVKNTTVAARVYAAQTSAYGYEVKVLGEAADGSDAVSVTQVKNAADLVALGGQNLEGTYVLVADINMNGAAMPTIGAAYGKTLTIVGNGHTISNATTAHTTHNGMKHHGFFYAYTNSTLTISDLTFDNIVVDATKDAERNYGAAVVVAYADDGSTINLTNVDVKNSKVLNSTPDIGDEAGIYVGYQTGTLNMVDCDSINCVVAGETDAKTGAFIGMVNGTANVTNCTTDMTIGLCNRIGGTLTVDGAVYVIDAAGLEKAVANGGDVVMANDVTLTGKVITTNGITEAYGNKVGVAQYGGTLDGNGNSLTETGKYAYVIVTHGGTIKNINIVGGGRGIVIYAPTEDVIIDNVVIDGPGYAINTAEHNGQDLIVTNSTIKGWTSLAGLDSVSFTGCLFGENSTKCWQNSGYDADYDRLIRPYGQASFTDCTFEKNFYIDLSALANGNTVTLTNCNCEGVVLTAENYANYITVELPDWATSIADCIVFN